VHVEVADPPEARGILLGAHETVSPVEGEICVPILTVPTNPPRLFRLSAIVGDAPEGNTIDVELGVILKSTTLIVMLTLWEREPLVAMTMRM
jgi:hypothetical protein